MVSGSSIRWWVTGNPALLGQGSLVALAFSFASPEMPKRVGTQQRMIFFREVNIPSQSLIYLTIGYGKFKVSTACDALWELVYITKSLLSRFLTFLIDTRLAYRSVVNTNAVTGRLLSLCNCLLTAAKPTPCSDLEPSVYIVVESSGLQFFLILTISSSTELFQGGIWGFPTGWDRLQGPSFYHRKTVCPVEGRV